MDCLRRVRCLGAIVDEIDNYHRNHKMLHILTSSQHRENDDLEGLAGVGTLNIIILRNLVFVVLRAIRLL